jgi:hypothetical protein
MGISSSELREAVADRPILFCGIENGHEHVLRTNTGAFAKQVGDPAEQRFLLFYGAGAKDGDLDVDDIGAPSDTVGMAIAR